MSRRAAEAATLDEEDHVDDLRPRVGTGRLGAGRDVQCRDPAVIDGVRIGLVVLVAGGEGLRPEGRDAEASTKESVVGGDASEYRRASSW